MIEALAEGDDTFCDLFLNEQPFTTYDIATAMRRATVGLKFTPVFMGSAFKNTGVQPLLDGVCAYLPNPAEAPAEALDTSLPATAPPVPLVPAAQAPLVGLAFKLEEGRYGQLTYMRIYQGTLKRGGLIYNARTGKKVKVPRLVRMHSDEMEVSRLECAAARADFAIGRRLDWSRGDLRHVRCRVFIRRHLYRWNEYILDGESLASDRRTLLTSAAELDVRTRTRHLPVDPPRGQRNPQLFTSAQPIPERRPDVPSSRRL